MAIDTLLPIKCDECGHNAVSWKPKIVRRTGTLRRQVTIREVECQMILSCHSCSVNLITMSVDEMADILNRQIHYKQEQ